MPHVFMYVIFLLLLAIEGVSNKCVQLYTYASAILCNMVIGWLREMC